MTHIQHGDGKRLAGQYSVGTPIPDGRKSLAVAYVLLAVGGVLALHRFYLGATGTGLLLLMATMLSLALTIFGVGIVGLLAVLGWLVVDIFLVPGMTRDYNKMVDERRLANLRGGL